MPSHTLIDYPGKVSEKDKIKPSKENATDHVMGGNIGQELSTLVSDVNNFKIGDSDEAAVQFDTSIGSISSRLGNLQSFTSGYASAETAYTNMEGYRTALEGDGGDGGIFKTYKETVEDYNTLSEPTVSESDPGGDYAWTEYRRNKSRLEKQIISYETTCQELVDNIDTCKTYLDGVNSAVPADGSVGVPSLPSMTNPEDYKSDKYTSGNYTGDYDYVPPTNTGDRGYYSTTYDHNDPKYKALCESLGVEPRDTGGLMEVKTVDDNGNTQSRYAFVDEGMSDEDRNTVRTYLTGSDAPSTSTTLTGNYNFRTGPGMNNSTQLVIPSGTSVDILSNEGDWVKVRYDGKEGYVHKNGLKDVDGTTGVLDFSKSNTSGEGWTPITSDGKIAKEGDTPAVYVREYGRSGADVPEASNFTLPTSDDNTTYRFRTGDKFNSPGTTTTDFGTNIGTEKEVYFSGAHNSLIVRGVNGEDTNVRLDGNDTTSVKVYGEYHDNQYGDRYIIKLADGTYGTVAKQYFTEEKPST